MRRTLLLILMLVASCAAVACPAQARSVNGPTADVTPPLLPVRSLSATPSGFSVTPGAALHVAENSRAMQAVHRAHHPLQYVVNTWGIDHYEIYFSFHGTVVADVSVGRDGHLGKIWTGPLATGMYGRGHYGQTFDSPWVWGGFGLMFLLPLLFLRRRSWLDVADLSAVLSFGISYALFDHTHLEAGVWLAYPPLLYLMARMLIRGRRATSRRHLDVGLPTWVLTTGLLVLVAARIGVTLLPPRVIDVGYASALGAYKILHGQSLYYASVGHPDTYGPIAYLTYVPFAAIWHVTGWAYVPAARAAAIAFDLLTLAGLVLLGRRLAPARDGHRLGLTLAWLWAACPFTLLGMVKSTNDGLVALLAVAVLLAISSPFRRGLLLGLAAAAKFFPAILLPLLLAGRRDGSPAQARRTLAGFVIAVGASVALFLPPGGLKELYDHTIGYQLTRPDVFSPWALHPGLAPIKVAIEAAMCLLAVALAVFPRGPRPLAQFSALAGALVIGVQLPALHWFYLYIVWFLPFVFVAVMAPQVAPGQSPRDADMPAATAAAQDAPELVLAG